MGFSKNKVDHELSTRVYLNDLSGAPLEASNGEQMWIETKSKNCKAARKIIDSLAKAQAKKGRSGLAISQDQLLTQDIDTLVACGTGWFIEHDDGETPPYSEQEYRKLLREYHDMLIPQLDIAVSDNTNFLTASSTPS